MEKVLLAVNGTLMRGLELAGNLRKVHASFKKKSQTEKAYRLYSINDQYPAMIKSEDGESIAVEVYQISEEGMKEVLSKEPDGLTIDKIKLIDGQEVYGVIGLPSIIEGQKDITSYKGWRKYINEKNRLKRYTPLIVRGIVIFSLLMTLIVLNILKGNQDIAEWMSRTIERAYGSFVSGISAILPFVSVTELLFIGLIGLTIFLIVRFIINLVRRKTIKAFSKIAEIAIMVLVVIDVYHLSCEAAYNRKPIPLPYYTEKIDGAQYVDIYNYFVSDINECSSQLEFQESGDVKTDMNIWEIANEVKKAYAIIEGNDYYHPHFGAVKPMMSSFLYREFQITGVTFSPLGEANIDVLIPVGDLPFTIAHELAHTKGVMREDEANQLAFYVCLNSNHPYLRFAAYNRYFYVMRSLATKTYMKQEQLALLNATSPELGKLGSFEYKFWKEHDLLAKIGDFFNNLYIKNSGVKEGTTSYQGGTEDPQPDPETQLISPNKYQGLFIEKYFRNKSI